jgi:hypothetical protein
MTIQHRLLAAFLVGLSGAIVALQLFQEPFGLIHLVSFVGACASGFAMGGLFGGDGRKGEVFAAVGAISTTILGAAAAGMILATLERAPGLIVMAPIMIVVVIASSLWSTLTWIASLGATHLIMRHVRRSNATP